MRCKLYCTGVKYNHLSDGVLYEFAIGLTVTGSPTELGLQVNNVIFCLSVGLLFLAQKSFRYKNQRWVTLPVLFIPVAMLAV